MNLTFVGGMEKRKRHGWNHNPDDYILINVVDASTIDEFVEDEQIKLENLEKQFNDHP